LKLIKGEITRSHKILDGALYNVNALINYVTFNIAGLTKFVK